MTWWRRDHSLAPINRYAQRLLRSHDSALRTRCFSRTPTQNAQHEDNDGSKRPSGMSNLEWMQMQHYNRWRKRFTEDPYQALFGASNDMLSGKGLKDWEWISKTFPRWMLKEMEPEEDSSKQSRNERHTKVESQYPKKVEIERGEDAAIKKTQSHFRQPSIRATRLDRDDTIGIVSPSDLRRPREQPHIKVETDAHALPDKPLTTPSSIIGPVQANIETLGDTSSPAKPTLDSDVTSIQQTLADQNKGSELHTRHQAKRSIWRETALQRRSSQLPAARAEAKAVTVPPVSEESLQAQQATPSILPTQLMTESPKSVTEDATMEKADHGLYSHTSKAKTKEDIVTPTRSTIEILNKLPKDDIDFLSAADIRASMSSKRSQILAKEERLANRQKLEATFSDTHKADQNIDPLIESKIINDQLVRRIEREMKSPQQEHSEPIQAPRGQTTDSTAASEAPIESTIDRLVNLVSTHFWQVPAEAESIKKTRLFFDQFMVRVRRGRNAMKQITEDLEKDIPASKELLKTLQEHDEMLDFTVRRLQRRLDSGDRQATTSNAKTNERLRAQIKQTDNRLNTAFALLNEVELPRGDVKNVLPSFKRRLRAASKVITRNLELTRQIAWSMQSHLEDPDIDRTILAGYQAVANSLLVVKHTQLALTLLLDRAMLTYGVPKVGEDSAMLESLQADAASTTTDAATGTLVAAPSEVEKAQIRAKVAAEERLANEVDTHRSAMRGLSDDGYAREPKRITRKLFENSSPLAHSLFRPFGPVIESLGKETTKSAETIKAEEVAKKKASDAKLVAEVRKAYEDTYGPITVGHKQLVNAVEHVKKEQECDTKTFEMLKEDNVSSVVAPEQINPGSEKVPSVGVKIQQIAPAVASELEVNPQVQKAASEDTLSLPAIDASTRPDAKIVEPATQASSRSMAHPSTVNLPTHYTILVHDPETGKLSITTSTTGPPRDTSSPLPLHQALASLSAPAKFLPFITDGLEVVSANKDILVLRNALDDASSTRPFETISASPSSAASDTALGLNSGSVNPIDGTARLSPTGYVGPEESQEQLEKEFEERRQAAGRFGTMQDVEQEQQRRKSERKGKRGGAGGVVKTAIWAAAACYVAGVVGEIATGA